MEDNTDIDKYFFHYSIILKVALNECTLNPTEVSRKEFPWLYALNNKYEDVELDKTKIGKWMVFVPKEYTDSIWNQIKDIIKTGHFWNSKISTSEPSNSVHAIMIYTKDYTDLDDVIKVLDYIESYGIKSPNKVIHYKTDEQTRAGVYSGGKRRASIYSSSTVRIKREPRGNPQGHVLSWRDPDRHNRPNRYFKTN